MKKIKNKRINHLFQLLLIITGIIIVRLLQIQIVGGDIYRQEASKQRTSVNVVPPKRGIIYDRNYNELAKTINVYKLYYTSDDDNEKYDLANRLSRILKKDSDEIIHNIDINNGLISDNLSPAQVKQIRAIDEHSLKITSETKRFYPFGKSASYLLGFNNDENIGVYGLEKSYNEILRGTAGKAIGRKNLKGGKIPFEESVIYQPIAGDNLVLTIDETIQSFIEDVGQDILKNLKANSASIIVTNPRNGEILAMQSFPELDPNNPYSGRTEKEINNLKTLKGDDWLEALYDMWRNPIVGDLYEPGSTFKMITTAAALEENTANENSTYHCDGYIRDIPGITIRCVSFMDPHGDESLQEAITNSCNPAYVYIARDLGPEKFTKYIKSFGFGEQTGINLPGEERGIAITKADKMGEATLATNSYGHGIAVTPLQMIMASNATINGGYIIEPKVVLGKGTKENFESVESKVKRQVVSEETSNKMRIMLKNVIENAAKNVKIPGFEIGGKSGTSIKIVDGIYDSEKVVSSFYGFFPAKDPQFSVLIVIDEPENGLNGTSAAGPYVKKIFQKIIKYKQLEAQYTPDEKAQINNIIVPDVVGITLKDATLRLNELGLKTSIHSGTMDENIIVIQQNPMPGEKVENNTIVYLEADPTKTAMVKMPNLIGMDLERAQQELTKVNLGYSIKTHSNGKIIRTMPEEGIFIKPESIIELEFFDENQDRDQSEDNSDPDIKEEHTDDTETPDEN